MILLTTRTIQIGEYGPINGYHINEIYPFVNMNSLTNILYVFTGKILSGPEFVETLESINTYRVDENNVIESVGNKYLDYVLSRKTSSFRWLMSTKELDIGEELQKNIAYLEGTASLSSASRRGMLRKIRNMYPGFDLAVAINSFKIYRIYEQNDAQYVVVREYRLTEKDYSRLLTGKAGD